MRYPDASGKGLKILGAVAQLVEQRTENPCVAGSIPAHTTKKEAIIEIFHDRFFIASILHFSPVD